MAWVGHLSVRESLSVRERMSTYLPARVISNLNSPLVVWPSVHLAHHLTLYLPGERSAGRETITSVLSFASPWQSCLSICFPAESRTSIVQPEAMTSSSNQTFKSLGHWV